MARGERFPRSQWPARRKKWAEHLAEWATGSLSQAEYCRWKHLDEKTFSGWKRRFGWVTKAVNPRQCFKKLDALAKARGGAGARVLAYFIPVDYVMQGMIADTGEEWKLFEQHKTIGMIAEHIFHPFAHLTGGHVHPCGAMPSHDPSMHNSTAMQQRAIFIEVSAHGNDLTSPLDDFNINT